RGRIILRVRIGIGDVNSWLQWGCQRSRKLSAAVTCCRRRRPWPLPSIDLHVHRLHRWSEWGYRKLERGRQYSGDVPRERRDRSLYWGELRPFFLDDKYPAFGATRGSGINRIGRRIHRKARGTQSAGGNRGENGIGRPVDYCYGAIGRISNVNLV